VPYSRSEGQYATSGKMASDEGLLEVLLWIGGAIAAYYVLQKVAGGISTLTAPATTAAANAFVALTSGPAIVPTGNIILPNGTSVPVSTVQPTANSDGSTTINYGGSTYTVQPGTNSDGDWTATD
jgi:hypothetical protein